MPPVAPLRSRLLTLTCPAASLRDDDLAYLMSMNTKDLHKLCGRLKEDRFLATHVRSELREGQQRPVNRTYYYIDYRQTIDAIKWRVYKIDKDMQGVTVPANEKKEYFCARCKSEWTQMEVLDSVSPAGFLCHRCGFVLTHDVERQSGGHQKSTRMNTQFKFITEMLPQIDAVHIPDNTFDVAFDKRRPVVRDATHQIADSTGVDAVNRPTAVKGLANTGPTKIAVEFSSANGPSEEDKTAELARKEQVARQNALPVWMAESTVTGEAYRPGDASSAVKAGTGAAPGASDTKPAVGAKEEMDVDDYFAKMTQKQEESSDEEDDAFEDVVVPAGGTPASTAGLGVGTAPVVPSPLRQSSLKRDASSGPSTGPGNSPGGSDGRTAKKVKLEEPPLADDGDSDDEIDFEDV